MFSNKLGSRNQEKRNVLTNLKTTQSIEVPPSTFANLFIVNMVSGLIFYELC